MMGLHAWLVKQQPEVQMQRHENEVCDASIQEAHPVGSATI